MIRFRVQQRLALTFGLYSVVLFGLGGLIFYERMREAIETELGEKLLAAGEVVAAGISENTRRVLVVTGGTSRTAKNVSRELGEIRDAAGFHRLYVFDRELRARADADRESAGDVYPELDFEREALAQVFAGERVVGHLFTGRDGRVYKSAYLPLPVDGGVEAALTVVGTASSLEAINRLRNGILVATLIGIAGSILVAAFMARSIVAPIRRLVGAADRIGAGRLEEPVPDVGSDEIGYLGHTLERMREAVLARERSLRTMLGGVAHEIRNPLGGIELFAGLLRRRVTGDPQALESVDRITHEVHQLDGIIKDFLEFARPSEPERVRFALADVVAEVEQVLEPLLARHGACVRSEGVDVHLDADPAQLRQVLLNLVQNAVQAMAEARSTLEGGEGPDGEAPGGRAMEVRILVTAGFDEVVVRVEDDGPGIPIELRERVFEPFYTTRQQGSGLGLAIARELVERNGGVLEIVDSADGGAAVVLRWSATRGGV